MTNGATARGHDALLAGTALHAEGRLVQIVQEVSNSSHGDGIRHHADLSAAIGNMASRKERSLKSVKILVAFLIFALRLV